MSGVSESSAGGDNSQEVDDEHGEMSDVEKEETESIMSSASSSGPKSSGKDEEIVTNGHSQERTRDKKCPTIQLSKCGYPSFVPCDDVQRHEDLFSLRFYVEAIDKKFLDEKNICQEVSIQRLVKTLEIMKHYVPKVEPNVFRPVICSFVNSSQDFWLQLTNKEHQDGLKLLSEWIKGLVYKSRFEVEEEEVKNKNKPNTSDIRVSSLMAVPYKTSDGIKWCRGQVKEILPNNFVLVHLMDYGNEKIVPSRWLYELPSMLEKVPPFCFRAKLKHVKDHPDHRHDLKMFFMKCMSVAEEVNCGVEKKDDDGVFFIVTLMKEYSGLKATISTLLNQYTTFLLQNKKKTLITEIW